MATFKKPLISIEVITMCGETYTVADTADNPIASNAFSQYKDRKDLALATGENEVTHVPYHAICAIVETKSTADVEKADPYHCDEEETVEP